MDYSAYHIPPKGRPLGYRFVAFPRLIWNVPLRLTQAEWHLLGYLIIHAQGKRVALTDDELLKGKLSSEGRRLDRGCGIQGRNNLKDARERLQMQGLVQVAECDRPRALIYELKFCEDASGKSVQVGHTRQSESDSYLSETETQLSVSNTQYKEVRKLLDPNENGLSSTASQDFQKLLIHLKDVLQLHDYDTWIRPLRFGHVEAGVLVLRAREQFLFVKEKFGTEIKAAIE